MTEQVETSAEDQPMPTELDMLKERATVMGIAFSNNIGVDTLRARIQAAMNNEPDPEPETTEEPVVATQQTAPAAVPAAPVNALDPTGEGQRKMTVREAVIADAMKLVRFRLTNMDARDKDLPGEIFTVANEYIGNVKKYIPYEEQESGWHAPQCIVNVLQEKEYLQIKTIKDKVTGRTHQEHRMVRKFAIEILPPLTEEERQQLAIAQAAAANQ